MEKIKVNDGGGLFDTQGFIDSLIVDCNALPNDLINGQNLRFCGRLYEMGQKLKALKEGVKNDVEGLQREVADLRRLLNDINEGEG